MKKLFKIQIVVLLFSLVFPICVLSYETNVHQQITRQAVLSSNIDQYLKNNLGITLSQGFNNRTAQEWLEQGSIWEDDNITLRWMNHFYDPTTGKGLNNWGQYTNRNFLNIHGGIYNVYLSKF